MSIHRDNETLNSWQRIVDSSEEIPIADLAELFHKLLDHLGLCVVVEETPDFTAYELKKRPST